MLGSEGAKAMAPIEDVLSCSKIAFHVIPASSVLNTPPPAAPT